MSDKLYYRITVRMKNKYNKLSYYIYFEDYIEDNYICGIYKANAEEVIGIMESLAQSDTTSSLFIDREPTEIWVDLVSHMQL